MKDEQQWSRTRDEDALGPERKVAFYLGTVILAVGLVVFLSAFWVVYEGMTAPAGMSEFGMNKARSAGPDFGSFVLRGFGGFLLIAVGGTIRGLGARGLRGSGLVLDPEGAREDLKPYSRMAGGMVGDAVRAAGLGLGERAPEVMVRCLACGKLNEEDSKFCQECGRPMGPAGEEAP